MFDPVEHVLKTLESDPLISPDFKRGLRSADRTHQEFKTMTGLTALDRAWGEINALGGYCADSDVVGCAVNDTVGKALAILERLGAVDPLTKKHMHIAGTTVGKDIDTCAVCGEDLRADIHSQISR
jgi:hypothetical protein